MKGPHPGRYQTWFYDLHGGRTEYVVTVACMLGKSRMRGARIVTTLVPHGPEAPRNGMQVLKSLLYSHRVFRKQNNHRTLTGCRCKIDSHTYNQSFAGTAKVHDKCRIMA